jgi:hypothetical protein
VDKEDAYMAKKEESAAKYISGGKLYQERARAALPLLVRQASQSATVYYSDLAAELGMANERNLNYVLGYVGDAMESVSKDWKEKIPPIQCLVINKRDRMPGKGIGWFITKKEDFRKLPRKEQRRLVKLELEKVFAYRGWSSVLETLGLAPAKADYSEATAKAKTIGATRESRAASFGGGGESAEHRTLKLFVAKHPEIVGLPTKLSGDTERQLLSGDVLDVFFQHGQDSIAVEVKSAVSSEADIVRGMFQCIKYRAVLEAQQAADGVPQSARAVLVLETKLPSKFQALKNILGIELVDEVNPG